MQKRVNHVAIVGSALILVGCGLLPQHLTRTSTSTRPQTTPPTIQPTQQLETNSVKLILTLGTLADLKIKLGDQVVQGQVLADPTSSRQILETQRNAIQEQLAVLASTEVKSFVAKDYAAQEAQVKNAQERLRLAEAAIRKFYQDSPYTDYARENLALPEEELQLAALETERDNARTQLEQAKAQLETVKSAQKNLSSNLGSGPDRADLLKQLTAIELQLKDLKPEYAPHNGIVRAIKPLKSRDETGKTMQVELTLAVPQKLSLGSPVEGKMVGRL